LNRA